MSNVFDQRGQSVGVQINGPEKSIKAELAALRQQRDELEQTLVSIRDRAREWRANYGGSIDLQRKRWMRLGDMADAKLEQLARIKEHTQ